MEGTVKGRRMNHTIKGSFTIRGTIKGSFTIRGAINGSFTIKGTINGSRGTIKIRGTIKGSFTIKGRINGNFTVRGRRMKRTIKGRRIKHTIQPSFACHDLSQVIITDILSRLSVKVLLRFKSVCKRWHELIESSEFVTLHYDKMSTKRKSLILGGDYMSTVSTFSSHNLEVSRYVDFPFFEHKKRGRPFGTIYGPCNGVWCLRYRDASKESEREHIEYINSDIMGFTIALWNPATRVLKALPKSCTGAGDGSISYRYVVNFGFGYDRNTNDYKVVKISRRISERWHRLVEVYSLSNDCWREIEYTIPIRIRYTVDPNSTSWKGIHYWLSYCAISSSTIAILSFNFSDEVFETIESPRPYGSFQTTWTMKLLVLHDSLALVRPYNHYYGQRFEVWKLKENNGGVKSWAQVSTVEAPSDSLSWRFLGFSEDGNAVIHEFRRRLMLYDLETHENKLIRKNDYDHYLMMHFYVESLVSVKGGGRSTTPSSFRKLACYDDIFSSWP